MCPLNRFHHLTDHAIKEHHDGDAVLICQVKSLLHKIDDLLDGGRRQDDQAVITIAAATSSLEIITLGWLDGTKAGAAAHDIDDDCGQFRTAHVGDPLLLQADAG